jgi:hypothetical protein
MSSETFPFYTLLDSATGPVTYNSNALNATLNDTRDSNNSDNSTQIGDAIDWRGEEYTLLGTTTYGVVLGGTGYYAGSFWLVSSVSYAGGNGLNALNTVDPYNYCFIGGTMIATPAGEVPVEYLKRGDMVLTEDGREVPVKWIGEQRVKNWMFTLETQVPVCISKGALGDGVPHTDLYVSADHGILIDGLVINASALVNGNTVRFAPMAEMPPEFTYYHIETKNHDVVLANGLAAETFIDAAGRTAFDNHAEYLELYGAERVIPEMDRPRISSARLLPDAIKARIGLGQDWDAMVDDPEVTILLSRGAA